jgi:hypothetical protein
MVIDPQAFKLWGSYFGDTGNESIYSVVNAYDNSTLVGINVIGRTTSSSNIATSGAFKATITSTADIFVAQFDLNGTCNWSTYYGGSGAIEEGGGITADKNGNIYFNSTTESDGLAFGGSIYRSFRLGLDQIIVKLNKNGVRQWASYYGGSGSEEVPMVNVLVSRISSNPIAVNFDGTYLCFAGSTTSTSQMNTVGAHQGAIGSAGTKDAFVARFNPTTGGRIWGTYFGGTSLDEAYGVALGKNDTVYVCGFTSSSSNIASTGSYDAVLGGTNDGFILKLNPNIGSRSWSTYYGGGSNEKLLDIVFNQEDMSIYAVGLTSSNSQIASSGAFQTIYGGGLDAMILKFTTKGARVWATYFGGSGAEEPYSLILNNGIHIAGMTYSSSGISTLNSFQQNNAGSYDGFLSNFSIEGVLISSTYFGGDQNDVIEGITITFSDEIFIVGSTFSSTNISTTNGNEHQSIRGGSFDGFIVKYKQCEPQIPSVQILEKSVCTGQSVDLEITFENGGDNPTFQWYVNDALQNGENAENYVFTPCEGDIVKVEMTSNATCLFVDPKVIDEFQIVLNSPITASVSISSNKINNTLCSSENVVFTANAINGGTAPVFKWFKNGTQIVGEEASIFETSNLNNLDEISVELISNASPCLSNPISSSNLIVMNVLDEIIASVTISSNDFDNQICEGESITFSANSINAGTSPTYRWLINGNEIMGENGINFTSATLVDNDEITVELTSNASPCLSIPTVTSNVLLIRVNPMQNSNVSITSSDDDNIICEGSTVTFTAIPTNGGLTPIYQWKIGNINVGTNSEIFTTSSLVDNDEVSIEMISNELCVNNSYVTSNVILNNVNVYETPSVQINSDNLSSINKVPIVKINLHHI